MFIDGTDDTAIGVVGQYVVGESFIQTLEYKSPEEFKEGMKTLAGVRRVHFKCEDESEEFTVYNTLAGKLNVPLEDVVCKDGKYLLKYTKE